MHCKSSAITKFKKKLWLTLELFGCALNVSCRVTGLWVERKWRIHWAGWSMSSSLVRAILNIASLW